MCHGAQLAIPGILKISPNLKKGDIVAIYTQKGEAVALAESTMSEEKIRDATKGYAFETKRIIMAPDFSDTISWTDLSSSGGCTVYGIPWLALK